MKINTILVLIIGFLCLNGCVLPVPGRGEVVLVPEFEGKVLDSVSDKPIEGVIISVDNRPESFTTTGSDGTFRMKEIRHSYYLTIRDPGGIAGYLPPAGDIVWLLKASHPLHKDMCICLGEYIYGSVATKKTRSSLLIRLERQNMKEGPRHN